MEGRNCPNCGAVIDKDVDKCAYCGISYSPSTRLINVTRSRNVSLGISFESVPDQNGDLFRVVVN